MIPRLDPNWKPLIVCDEEDEASIAKSMSSAICHCLNEQVHDFFSCSEKAIPHDEVAGTKIATTPPMNRLLCPKK